MLARIYHYQNQFNTLDGLKLVAIVAMFADHFGYYLLDQSENWRTFGRFAAPLFFFVAGYVAKVLPEPLRHRMIPYSIGKLGFLLLYGLILTVLNFVMHDGKVYLNILLVILFIKLWLERWDPLTWSNFAISGFVVGLLLGNEMLRGNVEYGLLGPAYALCGRLLAGGRRQTAAALLAWVVAVQFGQYWAFKSNEALLLATALLLWFAMCLFRFQKITLPNWLKNPLLALSRYSLEVYFFHLAAFKLYYIGHMSTWPAVIF